MKITDLKENISELIYKQILKANKINENCTLLREAIVRGKAQYDDMKLKNYREQNEILFHDNQLWIPFNEFLQMSLIREIHD